MSIFPGMGDDREKSFGEQMVETLAFVAGIALTMIAVDAFANAVSGGNVFGDNELGGMAPDAPAMNAAPSLDGISL